MAGAGRNRFARKRKWRHRIGRKYGRSRRQETPGRHGMPEPHGGGGRHRLRSALGALLAVEAVCMVLAGAGRMDIKLFRREEQYLVEWVQPWELDGRGPDKGGDGRVYGIRLCPDTLEIQFYIREHSIRGR